MGDEASIEQPYRLMDLVQEDLHLLRGLEQTNLAYMMNKPDRTVVQFRPLKDKYDVFFLELRLHDPYTAVVGRVADKLHVDPGRIRLARHFCTFDRPVKEKIVSQFNCLLDMLLTSDKVCDVLYYDVLDGPLPRKLNSVEIANGHPYAKQCCISVRPEHISVEDLLNDQEVMKLTNCNAKLRLVGVCENKIRKVFSLEEKIENIPEYLTLRVEEIPKKKGSGHHVIHVCNITKIDGILKFHEEETMKSFGFSIRHHEPFGEVKVRLQQNLFENEENIPVENYHFVSSRVS